MPKSKGPNKLKCIHDYCYECAGDSWKEVTLCHLKDCPLWEYRTGQHISTKVYKERMRISFESCAEEFAEIKASVGLEQADFLTAGPNSTRKGKPSAGKRPVPRIAERGSEDVAD